MARFKYSCLLLTFFMFNSAFAEDQKQYAIKDIIINGSGESPIEARNNAIALGQKNGFMILLSRLDIDENLASSLSDSTIGDMVAEKQIIDEKIAGNNYSATLNLTFSASFVKYYLGNVDLSEPVIKNNSYLMIPIKIVKDRLLVWEKGNDWKMAVENVINNNQELPITIIKGDVDDISNLNIDTIDDNIFSDFAPISEKYKTSSIILAYFDFDNIENKVDIELKTIRKFQTNRVRLNFVNVNQLEEESLINKVASKTIEYIVKNQSESSKEGPEAQLNIDIDVLISDLKEWISIKNKLENSNIIFGLRINSISRDLVKINVDYNNQNGDIISLFDKHGLILQQKSENGYFLSSK